MKYHVSVFVRGVSQEGEQQRGKGLRGAGRRGRLSVDAQSLYVQRARGFPCARSNSLPPDLALKASDIALVESWAFIRFPIGGRWQGVQVTARGSWLLLSRADAGRLFAPNPKAGRRREGDRTRSAGAAWDLVEPPSRRRRPLSGGGVFWAWPRVDSVGVRSGERQRNNVSARGRRFERSATVRDDQSLVASRRNYARVAG